MKEVLRKAALFGIGVFGMTKNKIESFVNKLVKEEQLTSEEGKKLVNDMVKEVKESRDNLDNTIRERLEEMVDDLGLATKKDLKDLEKRVEKSD